MKLLSQGAEIGINKDSRAEEEEKQKKDKVQKERK